MSSLASSPRCWCKVGLVTALLLLANWAIVVRAAEEEDEDDEPLYRPGLVAEFSGAEGLAAKRVDRAIAFSWREFVVPSDNAAYSWCLRGSGRS